ncbi:hypothetical protein ACIHFD_49425 [Nonomuraea sp. NPDC051941]|uniref:hypothetical protein n=1 Tax=Nonomuraea sp. NPDC051941 TaxID=3364373 RepID=UPI0037CC0A8C
MPARRATLLLLSAVILTGCSTSGDAESPPDAAAAAEASTAPSKAPATSLEWGATATGQGEQGQPLKITPVGVYHHKGDQKIGLAQNGLFVAVAVKVAATDGADHIPPPASGNGFFWKGDGETITPAAGADPPWVGRVNVPLADQDLQPGESANYVITFDALGRAGTLVYLSPDGSQYQWKLPSKSGGQGLRRVTAALDALGIQH